MWDNSLPLEWQLRAFGISNEIFTSKIRQQYAVESIYGITGQNFSYSTSLEIFAKIVTFEENEAKNLVLINAKS